MLASSPGTRYGHGTYFHVRAQYSHAFTKTKGQTEWTMLLALVLIGKTCPGDSTMKVPPPGFDSTTDGQHIFVTYQDAAAYPEYLITYQ